MIRNVDGTAGKCARCNRIISINGRYETRHGVNFGHECVEHVKAIEHLFSDSESIITLARTQHRLKMSADTKAGLAKRKQRLAEEAISTRIVDQDLLALGM